ncbi:MAG: SDR family NAD(P)-dependent oxidoreductase [Ignavibacteriaceae bacterium]|nr:SDR family NAD(P)-dependent oxidoreductase [Ignavibacteriaceae bacterium]
MRKHLLIFGSNGALGKGVTDILVRKDYEKIILFDSKPNEITGRNIDKIQVGNLADESNVTKAFGTIEPSKDIEYFLFTTVGGYSGGKNLWDTDSNELNNMLEINLKTCFLIGKYFARLVKDSAGGSILFTAAFTGILPEKGKIPYGLSKSGVIYLTETLAIEGAGINLSANCIAPYIIDTPGNREWMGKDYDYDHLIKPKEIGEVVHSIFLNYRIISGTTIKLPGRLNIQE